VAADKEMAKALDNLLLKAAAPRYPARPLQRLWA